MEIVTRSEAFQKNVKRYFTNRLCRRGHLAQRFTSSGACVECVKKPTGLFIRISVEVHQDDRLALELFVTEMLRLRGREVATPQDLQMSADERYYRHVIVPRFKARRAPYDATPRGYKSYTLPDGEMPW